jgi:hypothetical protein
MSLVLADFETAILALLDDPDTLRYTLETVDEGLRWSLVQYHLAKPGEDYEIEGLDGAPATTLAEEDSVNVQIGAAGYAALMRSVSHAETINVAPEVAKQLLEIAHHFIVDFKSALSLYPEEYVQALALEAVRAVNALALQAARADDETALQGVKAQDDIDLQAARDADNVAMQALEAAAGLALQEAKAGDAIDLQAARADDELALQEARAADELTLQGAKADDELALLEAKAGHVLTLEEARRMTATSKEFLARFYASLKPEPGIQVAMPDFPDVSVG